jgi:hypothetical protein
MNGNELYKAPFISALGAFYSKLQYILDQTLLGRVWQVTGSARKQCLWFGTSCFSYLPVLYVLSAELNDSMKVANKPNGANRCRLFLIFGSQQQTEFHSRNKLSGAWIQVIFLTFQSRSLYLLVYCTMKSKLRYGNYNFVCGSIRVYKLVSHIKGET